MRCCPVIPRWSAILLISAAVGCSSAPRETPTPAPAAAEAPRHEKPAVPGGAEPSYGRDATSEPLREVTLDLKDTELTEALRALSRASDVNIIADPDISEKVTLQLERVDWRTALAEIARRANCKVVVESERLIRLTQPPSITMEFQDADIKTVIQLLAKQAGANIIIGQDVRGTVTLSLKEVPWMEALEAVAKTGGYQIVREGNSLTTWRLTQP